ADHQLRAGHQQLSDFTHWHFGFAVVQADDPHLHVRERKPNRTRLIRPIDRVAVGSRWRFAHAKALQQLSAAKLLEIAFGYRRKGCRTADARLDGAKVYLTSF